MGHKPDKDGIIRYSQWIPGASDSGPDDEPRSYWERMLREEAKRVESEHRLAEVAKRTRTREGWKNEVEAHSWQGVPYPLGPAVARFQYTTPLNLADQARQCWADRASLDVNNVDVQTAVKAGAHKIPKGAAVGAAKAGAIGWMGGPIEGPAILGGAAKGAVGSFAKGAAKSAMDQICRGKK